MLKYAVKLLAKAGYYKVTITGSGNSYISSFLGGRKDIKTLKPSFVNTVKKTLGLETLEINAKQTYRETTQTATKTLSESRAFILREINNKEKIPLDHRFYEEGMHDFLNKGYSAASPEEQHLMTRIAGQITGEPKVTAEPVDKIVSKIRIEPAAPKEQKAQPEVKDLVSPVPAAKQEKISIQSGMSPKAMLSQIDAAKKQQLKIKNAPEATTPAAFEPAPAPAKDKIPEIKNLQDLLMKPTSPTADDLEKLKMPALQRSGIVYRLLSRMGYYSDEMIRVKLGDVHLAVTRGKWGKGEIVDIHRVVIDTKKETMDIPKISSADWSEIKKQAINFKETLKNRGEEPAEIKGEKEQNNISAPQPEKKTVVLDHNPIRNGDFLVRINYHKISAHIQSDGTINYSVKNLWGYGWEIARWAKDLREPTALPKTPKKTAPPEPEAKQAVSEKPRTNMPTALVPATSPYLINPFQLSIAPTSMVEKLLLQKPIALLPEFASKGQEEERLFRLKEVEAGLDKYLSPRPKANPGQREAALSFEIKAGALERTIEQLDESIFPDKVTPFQKPTKIVQETYFVLKDYSPPLSAKKIRQPNTNVPKTRPAFTAAPRKEKDPLPTTTSLKHSSLSEKDIIQKKTTITNGTFTKLLQISETKIGDKKTRYSLRISRSTWEGQLNICLQATQKDFDASLFNPQQVHSKIKLALQDKNFLAATNIDSNENLRSKFNALLNHIDSIGQERRQKNKLEISTYSA